ncbi:MAG: alpha-xylosidase, partial [Bacteroidota bacterium]|nr:alpha-xylosidase [Bacteroidota bacterium]
EWIVKDSHNQTKAIVSFRQPEISWWSDLVPAPAETIDLTLFPDGVHEVKFSAYDMFSPARHDAFALALVERNDQPNRVTCSLKAKADECFVGTGERFAKMDLSGRTFQLRNQDGQGVNNRRAYKNIPFYLSSEHYGLFLHTTSFAKFSLADHSTRSAQVLVEEPVLDLFFIGGDTAEQILFGYRQLTGFPTMPPLWSFGTWMSRMTYFSADEVNDICHRMRKEGYPCDVIHLDTGWFKTDWLCEWKFNDERFPDPKKFISDLKKDGYRVSLWQLPYISYNAEQYEEANANDYISKSERKISGSSNFSMEDYAGTIDFTYDKATEWYKDLLKKLLDMGVVCIKTDFGEDIHLDAEYHSMTPEKLHNLYPLLYQKAAYEITKEVTGDGIVWARAGWAGCQRYPLHWGGDSACSWDGLAGSLKGGLHIGLSGFGFWSHDVPGFHGVPNFMNSVLPDDIYVRWTQFGVFSSHLRYHGSHEREPWHYPAIAPIVKKWLQLRYRLIPYILEHSEKVTHTGYPVLRALLFHHPEDKTCWHIEDQYYFGDDMLVAPVMNSENRRDIYLPEGKWVNFFTGEILEGERWLRNVEVPLDQMPVYVKYGAEIPVYPENVNCTDEMDMTKVVKIRFDENYNTIA